MNDPASPVINPFKGLHFYTEEDRDLFFGREREIEEFCRVAQRDILSVLFARSGLGKTSLLRAGVIPRLGEQDFLPVIVRIDYAESAPPPTRQIVSAILLAAAEAKVEIEASAGSSPKDAADTWSGTLWEFFHRHQFWSPRNDLLRPVLILDQFEEVFTLSRHNSRTEEFLTQLADLAENRMPISVQSRLDKFGERLSFDTRAQNYKLVLALREDYVAKLDSLRPEMPAIMHNRYALAPLNRERALEVVQKAGRQWIADDVAREIVAAMAGESESLEPGAPKRVASGEIEPAYLSVMCDELFRRMTEQQKTEIDLSLVREERGNILGALYERSFDGLDPETRVFVEDRLLTAGGFRGSVPVAETEREGVSLSDLESLVNSRLLRFEDRLGTTHVELSHDLLTPIVRKSRDARRTAAKSEAERQARRKREAEFTAKLRRERRRLWAAVGIMALLVGGIGFYLWGWVLPYPTYCRDYVKRWGAAYPVGPLPASAVKHRESTYRLTQTGRFGPVRTMELIDSNQRLAKNALPMSNYLADSYEDPSDDSEKESRFEYVYDLEGRVVYEVALDRFGKMVWGFVYAPNEKFDGGQARSAKATFLGADGYPQPQGRSRAEFVEIRYDNRGFEAELHYMDRDGRPMPGPDGAYGRKNEYDDYGRPIRLTSLDKHGDPMNDEAGNAILELKYDKDGNNIDAKAFDANGEPTLMISNYHHNTQTYDQWGRLIEFRYFNLSDEPVEETKETGAHRVTYEYDDHGNFTSIKLYDKQGEPMLGGEEVFDFSAHEQRITLDSENRLETVAYFDEKAKPTTGEEGWHSLRKEYGQHGFVSVLTFFGLANEPVNQKTSGAHRLEFVNDASGHAIETRYYGADKQPINTLDRGYHLERCSYDKAGNLITRETFDVDGKPVADQTDGTYRFFRKFDQFRHPVLIQYFDKDGKPMNQVQGFHKVENKYDDFGSLLESHWYDKSGRPALGPEGVQMVRNTYDEQGQLTRKAYYDAENRAVTNNQGIHETLFAYNDRRQQTQWQIFGLNNKPVDDENGDHKLLIEYDERGRETFITILRADGSPSLDRELRIATKRQAFDKEGTLIEEAFYDASNHLVIGPSGFAKRREERQPDGRIAEVNYGTDGKPVFNPLRGFSIKTTDSRISGDTRDSYYGPNGALVEGPEGYAEVRYHWGDDGKLLTEAFFGPDGAPVAGNNGYHRAEFASGGEDRFFDAEGRELGRGGTKSVIFIKSINDISAPAAKAGLQAGDILWHYGNWSFPEALAIERNKGTEPNAQPNGVYEGFIAKVKQLSDGPTSMTVIRHGHAVHVTVPPLPGKFLGVQITQRVVPVAEFETWSRIGPGNKAKTISAGKKRAGPGK